MTDILICTVQYPNDPTNNLVKHNHFVACYSNDILELYSVSSIRGKEARVYDYSGNPKFEYYIIKDLEIDFCGLRQPSFIDCTKSYQLNITDKMDIEKLTNRSIPKSVRNNIEAKITAMKILGKHNQYSISSEAFLINNEKCRRLT